MKTVGVITEYNPFHYGHLYHLKTARELSRADVVIVVMSGNFLQRGEPALLDKWSRAKQALMAGADLVVELPFSAAVQSADYFTAGGVRLLQALNCQNLCFGTDSRQPVDYAAFAKFQLEHAREINEQFQSFRNNGENYPQQMTRVYQTLYPEGNWDFTSPNHILAMGYAKENQKYPHPMTLYPILRKQTGYHDLNFHGSLASASGIRKSLLEKDLSAVEAVVPDFTYAALQTESWQSWQDYYPYLRYQLLSQSQASLSQLFQMEEGLPLRMQMAARRADNFQAWMETVKTKRYTWTRLQRLAVYVLLQVKAADIEAARANSYVRILGFNATGQKYLRMQKKNLNLPLITNIKRENEKSLALDIRAGQIYQLGQSVPRVQDYGQKPLCFENERK